MTKIIFCEAQQSDLNSLVTMLAKDEKGQHRERVSDTVNVCYRNAFHLIQQDPNAHLIIGRLNHTIVAMAQINFITHLTYQGGTRAQIEGIRVHQDYRNQGIGKQLLKHLVLLAQQRDCHLMQLTTDLSRQNAYEFYRKNGFTHSHAGFKLHF